MVCEQCGTVHDSRDPLGLQWIDEDSVGSRDGD